MFTLDVLLTNAAHDVIKKKSVNQQEAVIHVSHFKRVLLAQVT